LQNSFKHSRANTDNFRRFTNLLFSKKAASRPKTSFRDYKDSGWQSNPFFEQFQRLGPIEVFSLLKLTGFQEKGTTGPYAIAI
jgi:hypothetical protein